MLSDSYLVPSLKRFCSAFMEENVEHFNTIDLIRMARTMMLIKLEQICIEYIAKNLEEFLDDQQFKELVIEDAQNIKARQETDSIDIIDDVRYYLSVSKNLNNTHLQSKYSKIDIFLNNLGLEA